MNVFVASPDWGGWIVAYFYLGGIAAERARLLEERLPARIKSLRPR